MFHAEFTEETNMGYLEEAEAFWFVGTPDKPKIPTFSVPSVPLW